MMEGSVKHEPFRHAREGGGRGRRAGTTQALATEIVSPVQDTLARGRGSCVDQRA
jgi:hypothetical protein